MIDAHPLDEELDELEGWYTGQPEDEVLVVEEEDEVLVVEDDDEVLVVEDDEVVLDVLLVPEDELELLLAVPPAHARRLPVKEINNPKRRKLKILFIIISLL